MQDEPDRSRDSMSNTLDLSLSDVTLSREALESFPGVFAGSPSRVRHYCLHVAFLRAPPQVVA